jgi:DNA polymerase-3 subunit gamma/tau
LAQALYNGIRPRTFAQVVGQEHVTDALAAALSSGRLHHAFLFSGPRGCGKTSSARILAASLNCVSGPTPTPCGVCEHCVAIRGGSSMDVIEIDAASHRGIDDAREIRERAIFMPASARFKVYIIDEAHQITSDAFNALLKLVEEPPPHLKFVFATTEPDKVLQTIRSRTHHYAFRLVPPAKLREFLGQVCTDEGAVVEPAVLPLVVRAGAGSVRDSLSVLDQLIAGAGAEGLTAARAAALLGLSDAAVLDDAVEALAAKAPAGAFSVTSQVMATGHDPRRFTMDLLERVRDLLMLQTVPDAPDRGLLSEYAPDQLERMRSQASRMGAAELSRAADLLHAGLVEMRDTMSPRLMLELILARVLLPGAGADPAALQVRLERLERRLAAGGEPLAPRAEPELRRQTPPQQPTQAQPKTDTQAGPQPAPGAQPAQKAQPKPQAQPKPAAQPVSRTAPEAWPETAVPGQPAAPAGPPPAVAEPLPPQSSPAEPAGEGPSLTSVISAWPEVLDTIGSSGVLGCRTAQVALRPGHPAAVRDGELVLVLPPGNAKNYANSAVAEPLLRDALTQRFGGSWRITVLDKPPAAGPIQLPPDEPAPSAARPPSEPARAHGGPGSGSAGGYGSDASYETDADVDSEADGERARAHDPVAFAIEALGAQIVDERERG